METKKILARYRAIAPKPSPTPTMANAAVLYSSSSSSLHLRQGRTRNCKRGLEVQLMDSAEQRQRPSVSDEHLLRLTLGLAASAWSPTPSPAVIVPRPVRPVRTTICVDTSTIDVTAACCKMTAEQVVAELEHDALPAVVSGSGNRVRLANDAYKQLVGQPLCPWLDSLPGASSSRRINGEVVLDVRRFTSADPPRPGPREGEGGFSCNSRISWERNGTLAAVAAPCDVMRLNCNDHHDYLFVWRFHTTRGSIFYCPA